MKNKANKQLDLSEQKQLQIESALSGNREAALEVLKEFADAVNTNQIPDTSTLRYIAECFESIINGEKPDAALHVKKSRGHPRLSESDLIEIALEVELDIRMYKKRTGKPCITKAKEGVAFGLKRGLNPYKTERNFRNQDKFEIVRKAYEKHKKLVGEIADKMGY